MTHNAELSTAEYGTMLILHKHVGVQHLLYILKLHSKAGVKCCCHIKRHVECYRFDSGFPHVNWLAKKETNKTTRNSG